MWAAAGRGPHLGFTLIRRDSPVRAGGRLAGTDTRPQEVERIDRQMRETLAENDVPADEAEAFMVWLMARLWDDEGGGEGEGEGD